MKTVIFLGLFAVVALNSVHGKFTDKYDNTNIKEILENPKLVVAYIKCGLDQGPCTEEGKELKAHIVEALENECADCTDKQKEHVDEVVSKLIHEHADYWKLLSEKYDKEGKYAKKYEKRLQKLQQ